MKEPFPDWGANELAIFQVTVPPRFFPVPFLAFPCPSKSRQDHGKKTINRWDPHKSYARRDPYVGILNGVPEKSRETSRTAIDLGKAGGNFL